MGIREFDEKDKFVIDQYIMNGARLSPMEEVNVNNDSLVYGETAALYRPEYRRPAFPVWCTY